MIDQHPSFSVIIPTYNRLGLVTRAIESALDNKPAPSLEILVVDDASKDGTPDALSARFAQDHRVRLFRSEENQGPSAARNRGLSHANGEFVVFLDSDDMLLPHVFAYALAAFEQVSELQYLTFEGILSSPRGSIKKDRIVRNGNPGWHREGSRFCSVKRRTLTPPESIDESDCQLEIGDFLPMIMFGDLFFLSGLFMRRSAALAAGSFNARYSYLEDWDFSARLCMHGPGGYLDRVGFLRESGNPDQLCRTGTPWKDATMHHRVLNDLRDSGAMEQSGHSHQWHRALSMAEYQLARQMLERRHTRMARKYFLRAIRHAYKPFKCLIWLIAGRYALSLTRII